jgi:Histidine kinase-, DNA gyrase B-, and HSP90-like ATPase
MKYALVHLLPEREPTYAEGGNEPVVRFCQEKRALGDSGCAAHYRGLVDLPEGDWKKGVFPCPYGLASSAPVRLGQGYRIVTAFWTPDMKMVALPLPVQNAAKTDLTDVSDLLRLIQSIEAEVRSDELEHFEAALHDARHLNQSISDAAERLLTRSGYPPDSHWDMNAIRADEDLKRYLTIFAASRDLAAAMLMHEISRDPSQASRDVSAIPVHRLFYRQFRISDDRLQSARMTWRLGDTDKSLRLSAAFRLLPKILIDNAIKYGTRDSEVSVQFAESKQFFQIACTSYGPLVRENELEKVFRPAYRGSNKGSAQGHGLGLWLAKIIVEANTGIIAFRIQEKDKDVSGRRIGFTTVEVKLLRQSG